VRRVPLSEIKNDLSRFLRETGGEESIITRNGKPAGLLIGFGSEDDWPDYRLENDPRFLRRISTRPTVDRLGHRHLNVARDAMDVLDPMQFAQGDAISTWRVSWSV
jgi:prevent-host-death family protein